MSDIVTLIQELGFPVAISVGLAFALYSVVRFILKEKVEDTLKRFDEKHETLQHRLDLLDAKIMDFEREMMDEFGKVKKWTAEIKSDLKVYIDLTMRNK
jgi:peptidoglycan hydrolase CwlO-like protein